MQWLDTTLIEPVWQQVAATTPTNPSSLTLALIGIGTLLLFSMRSRRRFLNQALRNETEQPAKQPEKRRAA